MAFICATSVEKSKKWKSSRKSCTTRCEVLLLLYHLPQNQGANGAQ